MNLSDEEIEKRIEKTVYKLEKFYKIYNFIFMMIFNFLFFKYKFNRKAFI